MSDRPKCTPSPPPSLDDLPLVDIGHHPIREAYLAHLRPQFHEALVRPLDLFLSVLLEGYPRLYLPDEHAPGPHEDTAAVGRDLRFCAGYLRQIARASLDEIPYESETVCRWCL